MRAQSRRGRTTTINWDQAVSLLYPIAAFFNREGLSRPQSLAALAAAIDDLRKPAKRRLEHIGTPTCYADLIAAWTRERKFLDSQGRPRPLALSGTNGFTALAKSARVGGDPKRLLSVLIRYRNVRRLSNGTFKLISPYFRASDGSKVAFEPIAYFLDDAASALTHLLKDSGKRNESKHFWRKVESARLSRSNAKKFVEFAMDRSLLFFEEMDDWLQAHSEAVIPIRGSKQLRVGLGLFSIYSR
jgi:Family of unknown function (DUF6502)